MVKSANYKIIIYTHYFNPKSVAERYFKGRPQYHSFVIEKIKKSLKLKNTVKFALDVGCGTGFSSKALDEISERVVGVDISFEMLKFAEKKSHIDYYVASAENLPLADKTFDLVTISQAIHWIDRKSFFAEADRVLKPRRFVVAYDNYFRGRMFGNEDYAKWYKDVFLNNFPIPPRERKPFKTESENPEDFVLVKEEWHENEIKFTKRTLIDYLVTITNVINSVENGLQTIEEVLIWLDSELEQFFTDYETKSFEFIAPIWYFKQSY